MNLHFQRERWRAAAPAFDFGGIAAFSSFVFEPVSHVGWQRIAEKSRAEAIKGATEDVLDEQNNSVRPAVVRHSLDIQTPVALQGRRKQFAEEPGEPRAKVSMPIG